MKNKNLKDLNNIRDSEGLSLFLENQKLGLVGTCAICGGVYVLGGNNPEPIAFEDGARCCSHCNYIIDVIMRFGISGKPLRKGTNRYYRGKEEI